MKILFFILGLVTVLSCSKNDADIENQTDEWSVDVSDITGKLNLFPLIENPEFSSVKDTRLDGNQLVGIVNFGSQIRVYPYAHTNPFEVVNDVSNGQKFAFSYCPITKSAIAFRRKSIFRASGLLYKNNVTPWEKDTETIWSQMLVKGINGPNINRRFNTIPVVETTWSTVKDFLPNAKVMSLPDGFLFPDFVSSKTPDEPSDEESSENIPNSGEFTYGILTSQAVHIFRYNDFMNSKRRDVTIQSDKYLVYGNSGKRVISAFKVSSFDSYQLLEDDKFPDIFRDNSGVVYNFLGQGSNGSNLEKPEVAYVAIWKAWQDIFSSFKYQE
ncbi:DUF3179 domain-containing (seleno)protein [uncultured Eudoraea sp.]|uniref:DUF3179 domain-containing (seleno)protein n=1 Tax=uncultured Eudoraea sp. TaxID=1035614 RepID=UPI002611F0A8|nr:DUF3179 domain-containing (seleno)protein [uncultured Eudoraea sp.]